jgi:hypothetical protein
LRQGKYSLGPSAAARIAQNAGQRVHDPKEGTVAATPIPEQQRYEVVITRGMEVFRNRTALAVWLSRFNAHVVEGAEPPATACRSARGFLQTMAELDRLSSFDSIGETFVSRVPRADVGEPEPGVRETASAPPLTR